VDFMFFIFLVFYSGYLIYYSNYIKYQKKNFTIKWYEKFLKNECELNHKQFFSWIGYFITLFISVFTIYFSFVSIFTDSNDFLITKEDIISFLGISLWEIIFIFILFIFCYFFYELNIWSKNNYIKEKYYNTFKKSKKRI
jgi:amino acid transporter